MQRVYQWGGYYLMQSRNKFRSSDISGQDLQAGFKYASKPQLRNSFSTNATLPIELSSYRATISNQVSFPENRIVYRPQQVKSPSNLREQLNSLQQKLNNAKRQMNKTHRPLQKNAANKLELHQFRACQSPPPQQRLQRQQQKENPLAQMKKSQIEQFISSQPKPSNITTASVNPYGSLKNNNYYLAEVIRARHEKNSLAVQHINTSILILQKCNRLKKNINQRQEPIVLPRIFPPSIKTLYLDLDETLIHCFQNAECEPDFRLNITIEGTPICVDITIRPYVLTFLKRISKKWEVVVFTASHQEYADAILNELDPEGVLFHHRLYRQHCTLLQDTYVKDLSRINRDLSRAVLVDNAAYSYCLQLANGIPILPYYDGKDFELSALEGYLSKLQKCEDVRVMNEGYFRLGEYQKYDESIALIEELYLKGQSNNFL